MMRLIRKNILLVEGENNSRQLYNIPFGVSINKYSLKENNPNYILLEHNDKPNYDFSKLVRLSKSRIEKVYNHKGENVKLSLIYENSEYLAAIKLLMEVHYMSNVPNGLFISLKRDNTLIGIVVFSKLTYTIPVGRQIYFSGDYVKKELKEDLRDYSNHNIGWISRIVTDKNIQSKGYGSFFLEKLPDILYSIFPNSMLERIEVLTSSSEQEIKNKTNVTQDIDIKDLKAYQHRNDFFCKAGYQNICLPEKNKIGVRKNYFYKDGRKEVEKNKVIKFYYMKELNIQNRLFVPLAKEAFDWFKNHNKQWEIRKLNSGQYNSKNIIIGRKVELRLGYRLGDSIWGVIADVKEFNNAEELVNAIDYKLLIPTADNKNEALERVSNYVGKDSKIITFKINKDNV